MIQEQLKYFLDKGALAHIDFGISRSRLTELLGNTNCVYYANDTDKFPSIYKYGRLEFYYMIDDLEEGLSGIVFQPLPRPADKGNLNCNYNSWNEKLDINKAIDYLNRNNIRFQEFPNKRDLDVRVLTTESDVKIAFDCQEIPGQFYLHKVLRFIDI
jgi:hypothetical protein